MFFSGNKFLPENKFTLQFLPIDHSQMQQLTQLVENIKLYEQIESNIYVNIRNELFNNPRFIFNVLFQFESISRY